MIRATTSCQLSVGTHSLHSLQSNMATQNSTMKAIIFKGKLDVALEQRPIPKIQDPQDIIVKVRYTALCGRSVKTSSCSAHPALTNQFSNLLRILLGSRLTTLSTKASFMCSEAIKSPTRDSSWATSSLDKLSRSEHLSKLSSLATWSCLPSPSAAACAFTAKGVSARDAKRANCLGRRVWMGDRLNTSECLLQTLLLLRRQRRSM